MKFTRRSIILASALVGATGCRIRSKQWPEKIGRGSGSAFAPEEIARIIVEAPAVVHLAASSDGSWVAYGVTTHSLRNDTADVRHFLQQLSLDGEAIGPPIALPAGAHAVRFTPDATAASMLLPGALEDANGRFVVYDLSSHGIKELPVTNANGGSSQSAPTVVGFDYEWSPSGRYVAFTARTDRQETGRVTGKGVLIGKTRFVEGWRSGLFALDISSGRILPVTPSGADVSLSGFCWSPDDDEIAVSLNRNWHLDAVDSELVAVNRVDRSLRQLSASPGRNHSPSWSPDGTSIAFVTDHGGPADVRGGKPAIIRAAGGEPRVTASAPSGIPIGWSPDSSKVYFECDHEMHSRMFAINAESATLGDDSLGGMESLTPEREMITLGRDGRTVVCARSGISTPPEVYCEDLTSRSKRIATGRITRLAQGFPLRDEVSVEDLNWKSTDKAFTIHGLLIRPARATTARHLPTVLCLGGDGMSPGMVHRRFRADGMGGAWLALAAQGYAVLVPNTRGRGGYGDAFLAGIRDGGSCIRLPFADAAAGLDHIISLAIADPDRLAVFGDGLGADIAAYALTRHQKFKAAVLHDLSRIHLVDKARVWPRNSWQWRRARDIFGIDDPEEFAQRSAILEQSALLQADRICTPTLIIGSMQSHFRAGAALNDCLARVNVPHATFLQLEDIGATRADKLTRSIEWLDFWVRGIEFPNATRAAEYNAWQIDGGWSS